MHAVRFREYGGPDVLAVDEIDRPDPGDHEALVEIHAAGVNPVDTHFREGSYEPFELPMTPGVDVAGEVVETSEYVEGFEAGDRVYGTGLGRNHHGGYAEYATVPTDRLVHLPEAIDSAAAGGRRRRHRVARADRSRLPRTGRDLPRSRRPVGPRRGPRRPSRRGRGRSRPVRGRRDRSARATR